MTRARRLLAGSAFAAAAMLRTAGADAADAAPSPPAPAASSAAAPAPKPPTEARPAARGSDITASLPCSACHTTAAWKTRATESEAGGFDHAKTGFPLTGMHAGAACVTCHVPGRPTPKRDCVSCHADSHRGRLSSSCDRCHSAAGWKVTRPLEIHRFTRLPLTGMHALADCAECHRRASEHQWSSTPVDCFGCHEAEYMRPDLRPVHQGPGANPPFSRDCSLCHRPIAWVPAFVRATPTGIAASALRGGTTPPANHDMRFPITFGVHRTADCVDCHASPATPQAVRCIGCHAHDPARLAAQHKQPIATSGAFCIGCHVGGARR